MKKIYKLNESDIVEADLSGEYDFLFEKAFNIEIPKPTFNSIKENIIDVIMSDIEKFFQNKTETISDNYTLTQRDRKSVV